MKMNLTIFRNEEEVNQLQAANEKAKNELIKVLLQIIYKKNTRLAKSKIETKYNNEEYIKITLIYNFNETTKYKYIYEFTSKDMNLFYDFHCYK